MKTRIQLWLQENNGYLGALRKISATACGARANHGIDRVTAALNHGAVGVAEQEMSQFEAANALSRVEMSHNLRGSLQRAMAYAFEQSHRQVTLEHLLLALTDDREAAVILEASSVDIRALMADATAYLGRHDDRAATGERQEPALGADVQHIIQSAAAAAQKSQRHTVGSALVLAAIVGDGRSPAAEILRSRGMTFEHAIAALKQTNATGAAGTADQAPSPAAPQPNGHEHQQPAPHPSEIRQPAAQLPPASPAGGDARLQNVQDAQDIIANARERIAAARGSLAARAAALEQNDLAAEQIAKPANAVKPVVAPAAPIRDQPAQPPSDTASSSGVSVSQPPQRSVSDVEDRRMPAPPPVAQSSAPPPQSMPPPNVTMNSAPVPPQAPARHPPPASGPPPASRPGPPMPAHPPQPRQGPPPEQARQPVPARANGAAEPDEPHQPVYAQPPPPHYVNEPPTDVRPIEPEKLAAAIPTRMTVGQSFTIDIRAPRARLEAWSGGHSDPKARDQIITKAMAMRLKAPEGGFTIEIASPETQWSEGYAGPLSDDVVSWRWIVTPTSRGRRPLALNASARVVGRDGLAAARSLPEQLVEVRVSPNFSKLASRLAIWLLLASTGVVIGYFGERIFTIGSSVLAQVMQ